MRLITHNMLTSNVKGVKNGFPLVIKATQMEIREEELNPAFIRNMIPKLEWPALVAAAKTLGMADLPAAFEVGMDQDEAFLATLHRALLEIHVLEGDLICPESGRKFPINEGIPNMILRPDEV